MPHSASPDHPHHAPAEISPVEDRDSLAHAPNGLIFAVPHSGRYLPPDFLEKARFGEVTLRATEDAFVDELIGFADLTLPRLRACFGRAYVDVNRHPLELDPRLISGPLPRGTLSHSLRVKAGYGVIPRCLSGNREIHRHPITCDEALERLERVHAPYHRALSGLIAATKAETGRVRLIDWHSMPASSVSHNEADIVLGDLFGESCNPALTHFVRTQLQASGLKVALNQPFAGGYTLEHHAAPAKGVEALQIEINRSLYMNEERLTPHEGFTHLQKVLARLIESLCTATF